MPEKYVGYCSRCVEFPHFNEKDHLFKPWCTLCYERDNEEPTAFWSKGKLGRFSFKCQCGYETSKDIMTSPEFDQALIDHFFDDHKMHIQDAQKATIEILNKEVVSKYLIPKPKRQ